MVGEVCRGRGLHPELERRAAWADHAGPLPIIEGSIINITVDHLPGERAAKPMWLWCSDPEAAHADLDWWWRSYLRRFDIEHTFRFLISYASAPTGAPGSSGARRGKPGMTSWSAVPGRHRATRRLSLPLHGRVDSAFARVWRSHVTCR